jgi:transcriptional regulator with XRE-family HTH domain
VVFKLPATEGENHMIYSTHLLRHFRRIIGYNIHRLRRKQRMPLPKLANMSGVPIEKIDHYELGKNEIPLDHILRIACALDVEVASLLRKKYMIEELSANTTPEAFHAFTSKEDWDFYAHRG